MRRVVIVLVMALVVFGLVLGLGQAQPGGSLSRSKQRQVALQATRNTRSLDGLPVRGGRIKAGLVYRSGALCFVTDQDIARLNKLGIRTVVDLRLDKEIAKDGPDKPAFLERVQNFVHLPMYCAHGVKRQAYVAYVSGNASVFRQFFELLASADNLPLLFHCSAGKDRTGILAALLLELLGADRSLIMDDYLQSQRNSPGLTVDSTWLEAVWQKVDSCGGVEAFLTGKGVSRSTQSGAAASLVEPL